LVVDAEGPEPKGSKHNDVEAGEHEDDDIDEKDEEEEGADAEKRRGQDNDERGYDDEADDDEKAIAEETRHRDLHEPLADDEGEEDGGGGGQVTQDNEERRGIYFGDDDDGEDAPVSTQEPTTVKLGAKGVKPKSGKKPKGGEKMAETLTVKGSLFEMHFSVKPQSPHIILAEVLTSLGTCSFWLNSFLCTQNPKLWLQFFQNRY
jgi:hypothetical protein